jgi:hypothetical protein
MSRLLLHLRHVPEDEAEEVEQLLADAGIDHFRTPASRWGLGAGAIWVNDDDALPQARTLMAAYQQQRASRARAERDAALREGRADTAWTVLRDRPFRTALLWLAILAVLGLGLVPFWLMMR